MFCWPGIFKPGSISGSGGFSSDPASSSDGAIGGGGRRSTGIKSFSSALSIPSREVEEIGRPEDVDLMRGEITESKRLRTSVSSGSAIGSGAILLMLFGGGNRRYGFGGSGKNRAEGKFEREE